MCAWPRSLADGRTEFALQERRADGEWGERRLPRARFFPAGTRIGRWLASSPQTVRAPGAASGVPGVEVRVAARLLLSGRMEFALQERRADGEWGERRLPRARFFPAGTRIGRWLASSPQTVRAPGAASGVPGVEVRVAARLLLSGRMEFALQERRADGEWGERRLPRARFFPAHPRVGRWLASSPLTVSLPPSGSPESDRAALVALYEATDGANWSFSRNWLSDRPIGSWRGVTTDDNGRVTSLNIPHYSLKGPLPAELGRLTNLRELDLRYNELSGSIPAELGGLTNLKVLNLTANEGHVPQVGVTVHHPYQLLAGSLQQHLLA